MLHLSSANAETTPNKTVTLSTDQLDKLINSRIDILLKERLDEILISTTKESTKTVNEQQAEYENFSIASKINTVIAFEYFLALHPKGSFSEQAKKEISYLKYSRASKENTIASYTDFINNHPDNDNTEIAIYKRAKLINTLEAYDSYISAYPDGAKTRNVLYQKARITDTVDDYNKLLKNVWPNDRNVIYYRDKAALEAAKKTGTMGAFGSFIETYPKSQWIDQAKHFYKYGYDLD